MKFIDAHDSGNSDPCYKTSIAVNSTLYSRTIGS